MELKSGYSLAVLGSHGGGTDDLDTLVSGAVRSEEHTSELQSL